MKTVSEETRAKMRAAQQARWADPAKRAAGVASIRKHHVGSERSEETRAKMSATHRARFEQDPQALASAQEAARRVWEQPGYRLKMALRRAGSVIMDDRGQVYPDACEAAQKLGVTRKAVYRALKHPFSVDGQRRLCAGRALERVESKSK